MFKQPSIPTRSRTVGVPIILMARKTPSRLMTQSPVEALKIEAELLLVEFNRAGQLQEGLLRLRNTSPICWATETKSAPTGELQKRRLIRHDYGHVKIGRDWKPRRASVTESSASGSMSFDVYIFPQAV